MKIIGVLVDEFPSSCSECAALSDCKYSYKRSRLSLLRRFQYGRPHNCPLILMPPTVIVVRDDLAAGVLRKWIWEDEDIWGGR